MVSTRPLLKVGSTPGGVSAGEGESSGVLSGFWENTPPPPPPTGQGGPEGACFFVCFSRGISQDGLVFRGDGSVLESPLEGGGGGH